MEGTECLVGERFSDAKRWFERGLERYPDDIGNRDGLAMACLFLGDFQAARGHWCALLTRAEISDEALARLLNNIAWVNLQIGGAEMLDEADRFSHAALQAQPWISPFQGTRGSVLVELGRVEEGLPLLRRAFTGNLEDRLKALNACYLALGESKRGKREESLSYLDMARTLDPQCLLLPRMVKEICTS